MIFWFVPITWVLVLVLNTELSSPCTLLTFVPSLNCLERQQTKTPVAHTLLLCNEQTTCGTVFRDWCHGWLGSAVQMHLSRHPLKKGLHRSFSHHHLESAHTPWPQGRSTAAQGMQNVLIQGVIFISLGCQYPATFQQPKNYLFLGTIFWTGNLSSTFTWFHFRGSVCLSPDPLQVLKSQFFPAFGKGWFFPSLKKKPYEA